MDLAPSDIVARPADHKPAEGSKPLHPETVRPLRPAELAD